MLGFGIQQQESPNISFLDVFAHLKYYKVCRTENFYIFNTSIAYFENLISQKCKINSLHMLVNQFITLPLI